MKICKKDRKVLIKAIDKLISNKRNKFINNDRYGICHNLSQMLSLDFKPYHFASANSKSWKHYNELKGSIRDYPIPNEKDKPLWKGKQLKLRISLLKHLKKLLKNKQCKYDS